jgi:membrane protein
MRAVHKFANPPFGNGGFAVAAIFGLGRVEPAAARLILTAVSQAGVCRRMILFENRDQTRADRGTGSFGLMRRALRVRPVRFLRRSVATAYAAYDAFVRDDGWAIASHISLTTLMSLFPFLIFVTALTGFLGTQSLADQVAKLLLEAWPPEVAAPIAAQITSVLTRSHGDLLTFGVALALYFSSSGVESLRIGLNRAYDEIEGRPWWLLRLESIGYVLVGAAALIALSFLIVGATGGLDMLVARAPWLAPIEKSFTFGRYVIATVVLIIALALVHKWLPAGRRRIVDIMPGIMVTLLLWILTGVGFGRYLAKFAGNYVSTYAGLASAMVALVFLYWTAAIFVYGGELNDAIRKARRSKVNGDAADASKSPASSKLNPPRGFT